MQYQVTKKDRSFLPYEITDSKNREYMWVFRTEEQAQNFILENADSEELNYFDEEE